MSSLNLTPAEHAPLAPEWSVEQWLNTDGRPSLDEYRGRVVVLHAFQMLCPGCVSHGIPQAQRIHALFPADDVSVLGLHTVFEHHDAMTAVSLRAFLHEYRVAFPVGIDEAGVGTPLPKTMETYRMRGTPSLILIDDRGRLRLHAFGRPSDMEVGAAIGTLLAERRVKAPGTEAPGPLAPPAPSDCTEDGCTVPPTTDE